MRILVGLWIFGVISGFAAALSKVDLQKLKDGGKVVINEELDNMVWPKMTVHMYFETPPFESFAFYVAYKNQKNFVPDLIKSQPYEQKSPTHVLVSYVQETPWPLADAEYKTGNVIEKLGKNQYKISWYQVESNSTESTKGHALFRPLGTGTWFTYVGHTEPKSMFGGLLKDIAPKNLQKTLVAIKEKTEKTAKENPKLMQNFKQLVNDSFAGKWIYIKPKG